MEQVLGVILVAYLQSWSAIVPSSELSGNNVKSATNKFNQFQCADVLALSPNCSGSPCGSSCSRSHSEYRIARGDFV